MKKQTLLIVCTLAMSANFNAFAISQEKTSEQLEYDKWLKLRFSEQHKQLIPKVAVADMFFACDKAQNKENASYQLKELIEDMDRDLLAEKLTKCLAGASMKSDLALNYGLYGCFYEQLGSLSKDQKQEKMRIVTASITSLGREERQKSFSRCVTDQTIRYLK